MDKCEIDLLWLRTVSREVRQEQRDKDKAKREQPPTPMAQIEADLERWLK